MKITTIGLDLAKNVMQVHGVEKRGKAVVKKQLRRHQVASFFANVPACQVGMEACGGAHHWARKWEKLGHRVKLMAPQFVKPYVKTNKNDTADAEAICFTKRDFVYVAEDDEYECPAGERLIWRFQTVEQGLTLSKYWSSTCPHCDIRSQCTPSQYRRVTGWEHEEVLEAAQAQLDLAPDVMRVRRQTAEHPFGTLKSWVGHTHFLSKTLEKVSTEMSLHVLAYNLRRVMNILGAKTLIEAMQPTS